MPDSRFFKNQGPFTLEELALTAGAKIHQARHSNAKIADIAPLNLAESSQISFLDNPKYADDFKNTKAGACIVRENAINKAPENTALLISDNPYLAYAEIAAKFYPVLRSSHPSKKANTALSAAIDESAEIGANCTIEANVTIGPNAQIGEGCRLRADSVIAEGVVLGQNCTINANATISNSIIGNHVIIHQGANIGQDGFGFATTSDGVHIKVPQLGRVIIEDDVEIGAGSCIDRGSGPDTILGEGTKIDNLVQIGHNVQLGKGCIVVSGVGISGSTTIGNHTVIGGQAGIAGHLTIGSAVQIAAKSGVTKDIPDGTTVGGFPAVPIREWRKKVAIINKMIQKHDD